jgi:hypothetical protein
MSLVSSSLEKWQENIKIFTEDDDYDDEIIGTSFEWILQRIESKPKLVNILTATMDASASTPKSLNDIFPCKMITFNDLIGLLQNLLTNVNDKIRNRSTLLLAEIINKIDINQLHFDGQVLNLLIIFFCRRLGDYPSILPSLMAINGLLIKYRKSFNQKYCDIITIYQSIFNELKDVQSFVQSIRFKVFELFHTLLSMTVSTSQLLTDDQCENNYQTINSNDIVEGILSSIESERDPRCLLSGLQIIYKLLQIYNDIDEKLKLPLFNVIACYFPITFIPPADNPHGITNEILTNTLEDCLCHHTLFNSYTLTLFIDNLTSDIGIGRVRSMICIVKLCRNNEHFCNVFLQKSTDKNSGKFETYMKIFAMKLFDIISNNIDQMMTESDNYEKISESDINQALVSITEISALIGINFNYAGAFNNFTEYLIQHSIVELIDNIEGIKGSKIAEILFSISKANIACAKIIVEQLIPILMPKLSNSIENIRQLLSSNVKSCRRGIRYFPSLALSSTNSMQISSASFIILSGLLQSIVCLNVDVSSATDFNPLNDFITLIFGTITNLFKPLQLVEDTSNYIGRSDSSPIPVSLPIDITTAISEAMKCMKDLLLLCNPVQLNGHNLPSFISMIADITLFGVEALWIHTNNNSIGVSGPGTDRIIEISSTLLSAVASQYGYEEIIITNCIKRLLSFNEHNQFKSTNEFVAIQKKMFITLATLSKQGPVTSITIMALPFLLDQAISLSSNTLAETQMIALDAIIELVPSEESLHIVNADIAYNSYDIDRAKYLIGNLIHSAIDENDSFLFKLINWILTQKTINSSIVSFNKKVCHLIRQLMLIMSDSINYQINIIQNICKFTNVLVNNNDGPVSEVMISVVTSLLSYLDNSALLGSVVNSEQQLNTKIIESVIHFVIDSIDKLMLSHNISNYTDLPYLVAILVNKLPNGPYFELLVNAVHNKYASIRPLASVHNPLSIVYMWMIKGLIMRKEMKRLGDKVSVQEYFINLLLHDTIEDENIITASNISILTKDHNYYLSSIGGYCINPLWRQKYWSRLFIPLLSSIKTYKSSITDANKTNICLLLITGLACGMNTAILSNCINDLVMIIVQSFSIVSNVTDLQESDTLNGVLKNQTIKLLLMLLESNFIEEFIPHVSSIIPVLVIISQSSKLSELRGNALKCLLLLVQTPYSRIHPLKQLVIKEVGKVLDDKKRNIRQLASTVRNAWIVIK